MINKRINSLCSGKTIFDRAKLKYEEGLKNAGFEGKLSFINNKENLLNHSYHFHGSYPNLQTVK